MPRRTSPPRSLFLAITLLLLAGGGVAWAGTVYVPLPGITSVGTTSWEAEVTFANPGPTAAIVKGVWLADDSDGFTRVGAFSGAAEVLAGRTLLNKPDDTLPGATFRGLLELSGSPNLRYLARLTGTTSVGKRRIDPHPAG